MFSHFLHEERPLLILLFIIVFYLYFFPYVLYKENELFA